MATADIGKNLYNCYATACLQIGGASVDPWDSMEEGDRDEWRRAASLYHELLTSGGNVYIVEPFELDKEDGDNHPLDPMN